MIALTLSVGTTAVSYVRTAQQDLHDRRVELNGLIEWISAIQREGVDLRVTYATNPVAITSLSRILTQEQLLVAKQAARLMDTIPDQVGAAEYALVASVLIGSNIDHPALELLAKAVDRAAEAGDVNDLSGSLRTLGSRLFAIGRADEGRQRYGEALLVFDKFHSDDAAYVASTQFDTQLFWSGLELQYGTCDRAKQHAADARTFVPKLAADDPRIAQLISLETAVATCTPGPTPTPGVVP